MSSSDERAGSATHKPNQLPAYEAHKLGAGITSTLKVKDLLLGRPYNQGVVG